MSDRRHRLEVPMAGKTYVCVAPVVMKDSFDNKYKSSLPKRVTDALAKAVDRSSKLTTKPPSDKKAEGFYLTGNLSLTKTDKGVKAERTMVLADGPKKSIFGGASSQASTEVRNPDKIDKDVDAIIDALIDDVQSKVIKEFEKRAR